MIYLILAIVSSMLISVLMRVSEKYCRGSIYMLAANYLMCCAMAWFYAGTAQLFPASGELPLTMGLGAINGLLYLGGFVLLQWNISRNGVVLPATFMKLGVLVPTLMSIFVFGEMPGAAQVVGIIAAVCAILMVHGAGKGETAGSVVGLVFLLLSGGAGDAMSKIYDEIGSAALKDHFLLYTFIVALLLCLLLCIVRKQKPKTVDVLFGLAIGVPNYFSARFLLLAIQEVPAVVAYPSYSVGTIVLITAAGVALFHERLGRRKLAALGVILAALVLLNL